MEREPALNRGKGSRRSRLAVSLAVGLAVMMVLATAVPSHAVLNVTPGSVNAPVGKDTRVTLTWTLTGTAFSTWSSSQGFFEEPAGSLGTNPVPLSIVVGGTGVGTVTESLLIPASLVNPGSRTGASGNFTYRRDFTLPVGGPAESASLSIIITYPSQAAGPVSLRRVELYFEVDGRRTNEVTVGRNSKGLSVLADLSVNGTGYLEGYWEVDGRRIENIRENASFGSKITVRSSGIPGIPTFQPGLHSVRLVVTKPLPEFTLPRIAYIVTSGTAKGVRPLFPLSPKAGGSVNGDTVFSWNQGAEVAYVLTFRRELDGEEVLTAQTKSSNYQIPAALLVDRFTPGTAYLWQIQGHGPDGEVVSESRPGKFTVEE